MGTYRLGIVLLSDNMSSEQMLYSVELSSDADSDYDCVSDEIHNTTLGKSVLNTRRCTVATLRCTTAVDRSTFSPAFRIKAKTAQSFSIDKF